MVSILRSSPTPVQFIEGWANNIVKRLPEDEEDSDDFVYHTLGGCLQGALDLLRIIPSYNTRGRYCACCLADVLTSIRFHMDNDWQADYLEHDVGCMEADVPHVAMGFSQLELLKSRNAEYCLDCLLRASWYVKHSIVILFRDDGAEVDNLLNDYLCVLEDARTMALALTHKPNKISGRCVATEDFSDFESMD